MTSLGIFAVAVVVFVFGMRWLDKCEAENERNCEIHEAMFSIRRIRKDAVYSSNSPYGLESYQ